MKLRTCLGAVLILLILFAGVGNLKAQTLGFGVKAGADLAGQNLPAPALPNVSFGSIWGFAGGVFGDLSFTDFLAVQAEGNFIQRGTQTVNNNFPVFDGNGNYLGTTNATISDVYSYLEIPLLLKGRMGLAPGLQGYILAGPSVGFLLNENTTLIETANGNVPYAKNSINDTKYYPSTDWCLDFGIGVEYQNVILDIRYGLGLTSALQNADQNRQYGQNDSISFQLGYRLL